MHKIQRAVEALNQALNLIQYAHNNGFKYEKSQLEDIDCIIEDLNIINKEISSPESDIEQARRQVG